MSAGDGRAVLVGGLPGVEGGLALAAGLGVALADTGIDGRDRGVVLVEYDGGARRRPTLLASASARELESRLAAAGLESAARGRLAWVVLCHDDDACERLRECASIARGAAVVVHAPIAHWESLLVRGQPRIGAALLRAELPRQRSLAALAVGELRARGLRVRIDGSGLGRVATRRALAGIECGGAASERCRRLARRLSGSIAPPDRAAARAQPEADRERPGRRLFGEEGQALPLVLGAVAALVALALTLAAFGGAISGTSRAQRAADLSALSAARAMRDDFERLFTAPVSSSGAPNPAHLSKGEYLRRARDAALEAARKNGVAPRRIVVSFPDAGAFAPLRVRVELVASVFAESRRGPPAHPSAATGSKTTVDAEAEAVPPSAAGGLEPVTQASGGGYSGPLVTRQGEPMRPDVAAAFDRMAAAAQADGFALIVNSAFRSDAEQAALFAANPDPRWVAPPGTSLHRCATELDLGPPSAYGWLAAHAPRFGFVKRYSWEPWHFGYKGGPPPCSAAGDALGSNPGSITSAGADGEATGPGLPAFVPARFRDAIAAAAARWDVPAALLAAQLLAESNFNPFAVSSAGAAGIAQFMPATAAAYGLDDPFDPEAAIDAQGHLMSDLLEQFDGRTALALAAYNAGPAPVEACSCVPAYPETQAYVARILGLLDGAGALSAPALEVRLVD